MPDLDGEQIQTDVGEAISTVMRNHEGSMLVKWCAIVDTMDAEGDRSLWTFANSDARNWDIVGLLSHALSIQNARTVRDALEETE